MKLEFLGHRYVAFVWRKVGEAYNPNLQSALKVRDTPEDQEEGSRIAQDACIKI